MGLYLYHNSCYQYPPGLEYLFCLQCCPQAVLEFLVGDFIPACRCQTSNWVIRDPMEQLDYQVAEMLQV